MLCSSISDLMKEDGNLRLAPDPVQHEVERAKIRKEETKKDVRKWLTVVSNVIEVVKKLEEEKQANKTCLSGDRPNVAWRYRSSREAEEIRSLMLKLLEGGKFTRVSHQANLFGIKFSASRDFVTFESTKTKFDLVIEALKDDKINIVGIYGMGGVGKRVRELNIFKGVVLATVSQTPNLKSIQHHSLSLESTLENEDLRARRLFMRFKNEKKILIILDDVWAKIDLSITGIPSVDDRKGCKILLTTRRKHMYVIMGCESQIPLNVLKGEEGLAILSKKMHV